MQTLGSRGELDPTPFCKDMSRHTSVWVCKPQPIFGVELRKKMQQVWGCLSRVLKTYNPGASTKNSMGR